MQFSDLFTFAVLLSDLCALQVSVSPLLLISCVGVMSSSQMSNTFFSLRSGSAIPSVFHSVSPGMAHRLSCPPSFSTLSCPSVCVTLNPLTTQHLPKSKDNLVCNSIQHNWKSCFEAKASTAHYYTLLAVMESCIRDLRSPRIGFPLHTVVCTTQKPANFPAKTSNTFIVISGYHLKSHSLLHYNDQRRENINLF